MKQFYKKTGALALYLLGTLWLHAQVGSEAFEKSPAIDVGQALYGKIAGLNVYQGTGSSANNVVSLSVHGRTPLVLIDGFPRALSDLTALEIDSCYVLTDAVSTALYGMRGANGVVIITTKRSQSNILKMGGSYHLGVNTQMRAPRFADAYTYGNLLNLALEGDGLAVRYRDRELDALRNGSYPYDFPNVDWWGETMNNTGLSHNLRLTFDGGGSRFRFYSVIDYYRDHSMLKENTEDKRFDATPTDTRLALRVNVDVQFTETTMLKIGLKGALKETRGTVYGSENIFPLIYGTPSAAFPVRYENGIWGGSSIWTNNPVGLLKNRGHIRSTSGALLADISLRQALDAVTKGLSAEVNASFDNSGAMQETSTKGYRYMNNYAELEYDGTLVTHPVIYGTDTEILGHSTPFGGLMVRSDIRALLTYDRTFGWHRVQGTLSHDWWADIRPNRNSTRKNQTTALSASYTYDDRYTLNAVVSYGGSAYLPDGDKFAYYPAVSATWKLSNESWLKGSSVDLLRLTASYGLSGWDGNLSHELWRTYYGPTGNTYYFGENATSKSGAGERVLPTKNLVAEKIERTTLGIDFAAFGNRLSLGVEGYSEERRNTLVSAANYVSNIIGASLNATCAGIYRYKGLDASIGWRDRKGDFSYSAGVRMSYMDTEIVNDGQAYQEYDYLYTRGNRIGQMYGLQAIGFFHNQQEINNSPEQKFSVPRPGDVKYKDQNGDNIIDERDVVRMFGSSVPHFYFGFDLGLNWKRWELSATFQGLTGKTVSLLNSPLYQPLVTNGNISRTFLDRETYWTPNHQDDATMPRLTTLANANNYRASSLWYRDGSFIKLRNLLLAYTFPKQVTRLAEVQLFVQGTNLFSLDNLDFADPENMGAAYPSVRTWWAGIKLNF